MGKSSKRQYTLEFKQQAVELAIRMGVTKSAQQLGINVANVQRWKSELKKPLDQASKQTKMVLEEEVHRLKKEVDELKKVNQILKRAAAFFSQDHLK